MVMMAVICSCLRPLVLSGHQGRAKKRAAAIRQLGSYIWVPPSENPQGLGQLYVWSPCIGKRKVDQSAEGTVENAGTEQRSAAREALEIQTPKIGRWFLQFQSEFPPCAPFMAPPDQDSFARNLVDEIYQSQLLPHGKTLGYHGKTSLRAHVDGVPLRAQVLARVSPLNRHCHARIKPRSAANIPHPGFKT